LNNIAKAECRQPTRGSESWIYQGRYSTANHTDDVYLVETSIAEHDDTHQPRPHYE
jgi:hypothetical protein